MPFRGTVQQCLAIHLRLNDNPAAMRHLCDFTGSKFNTIRGWRRGRATPSGMAAIHAMVFLDLLGYDVEEKRTMSKQRWQLAQLVAYRVLKKEQLEKLPGCRNRGVLIVTIMRPRVGTMHPRRQKVLATALADNASAIQKRRKGWKATLSSLRTAETLATSTATSAQGSTEANQTDLVVRFLEFIQAANSVGDPALAWQALADHFDSASLQTARTFTAIEKPV